MLKTIVTALALVVGAEAVAEERLTPSWIKPDASTKQVEMDVVAGANPNNNNWNFNGYYEGNATVVVPEGWRVAITFTNRDANYPHSLVVIEDPGSPEDLPEQAGREEVAIARAYSKSPIEGIFSDEKDVISFRAGPAGDYLWFCGVPAHGLSGMWIYFKVAADAEAPHVILAEGAKEGRV